MRTRSGSSDGRDEARLVVSEVSKSYAGTLAVDNVSFSLGVGESLGIIGESGSGKTTLARVLIGIEAPTAGEVTVCGRHRAGPMSARERREQAQLLQVVFQDPYSSLDPMQSGHGAVDEILKMHQPKLDGRGRADRSDQLAELVGLDARQFRARPSELSGGQRQRVAIAKALAPNPSVLILDEAVSALDVSIQAQVLNLLNDIREQSSTSFLFITHDLAVARQVTDRCLVMRRGRVVEEGATSALLDHPQDAYTRRLIASVPRPGWRPAPPETIEPSPVAGRSSTAQGENNAASHPPV